MRKFTWYLLAAVSVLSISIAAFFLGGIHRGALDAKETVRGTDSRQTADSMSEGIKVHGDWGLTVSDPDGSNAMVYNFENALAGSHPLGHLLLPSSNPESRQIIAWQINLRNDELGTSGNVCTIFKNDVDHLLIPTTFDSAGGIYLSGNCVIPAKATQGNLKIHTVSSRFSVVAGTWGTFTSTNLAEPIPVSANQIITVAVKITFQ